MMRKGAQILMPTYWSDIRIGQAAVDASLNDVRTGGPVAGGDIYIGEDRVMADDGRSWVKRMLFESKRLSSGKG